MDISRATNEQKLYLSKWYFRGGFALLPFLWVVNAFWFYDIAFNKPIFDEQKQIRNYVIFSAIGSLVWFIVIAVWISLFQAYRIEWGEWGDAFSFVIPLGSK